MTYWRLFRLTDVDGEPWLAPPWIRGERLARPDGRGWLWAECLWCWPIHDQPGLGSCLGGLHVCVRQMWLPDGADRSADRLAGRYRCQVRAATELPACCSAAHV